jgi:hypothetical protein
LANVSLDDVRDAINVSETDVPDVKLQKMVKRAEVTLELDKEIDSADCTDAEKEFITLLAAYNVNAKMQSLEIGLELGREPPQLADYVFALRSKLDHVSRYKTARQG